MGESIAPVPTELHPLFRFRVEGVTFLCEASAVEAVTSFTPPVPLPRVPAHLLGLVTYDQRALVLVDLALLLGLTSTPSTSRARTLVVTAGDYRVGLPVDQALGVVEPTAAMLRAVGEVFTGRRAEFLRAEVQEAQGVGAWLDLERLLEAARV